MNESSQKWQGGIVILLEDLSLLVSVYVAQFIVWRVLRRRRRERAARLRLIQLVDAGLGG